MIIDERAINKKYKGKLIDERGAVKPINWKNKYYHKQCVNRNYSKGVEKSSIQIRDKMAVKLRVKRI